MRALTYKRICTIEQIFSLKTCIISLFFFWLNIFILTGCEQAPGIQSPDIQAFNDIQFIESGIGSFPSQNISISIGLGDYDGDNFDDIALGAHLEYPHIWKNMGDDTFIEIPFETPALSDTHGMAFADFDNDGDQDLIQTTGGNLGAGGNPGGYFINQGDGVFENLAAERNIDFINARGRLPLILDIDRNGLLDVFYANEKSQTAWSKFFFQLPDYSFTEGTDAFSFKGLGCCYSGQANALYAHFFDDDRSFMLLPSQPVLLNITPAQVEVIEITKSSRARHMIVVDIDNDLLPDLVSLKSENSSSVEMTDTGFLTEMFISNTGYKSIKFSVSENTPIEIFMRNGYGEGQYNRESVFIGDYSNIWRNPMLDQWPDKMVPWNQYPNEGFMEEVYFSVDQNDQRMETYSNIDSLPVGVFVYFNGGTNQYEIIANKLGKHFGIKVKSEGQIVINETIGFNTLTPSNYIRIFHNTGTGFVEETNTRFGNLPYPGNGLAAGDFDNDGDQDLYLVLSRTLSNTPNIILNNDNGVFHELTNETASGTLAGRGDEARVADFNNDGLLDIFISNGFGSKFIRAGPLQYFKNTTLSNYKWIGVLLIGNPNLPSSANGFVDSRDAIGARVIIETADGQRQIREVGINSQDTKWLHFGIGNNPNISTLTVRWLSGRTDVFNDVDVNRKITIIQDEYGESYITDAR